MLLYLFITSRCIVQKGNIVALGISRWQNAELTLTMTTWIQIPLQFSHLSLSTINHIRIQKINLPFFLCIFYHCRYPSRVFVGDTFCYLAGMTFAVVGILGHFSKTLLLFFIPQVFNFLYSIPQLFHFVPCPRHRLPKYNSDTDLMECSRTQFRYSDLSMLGKLFVRVFKLLRIIQWSEDADGIVTTNNFTLINLTIVVCGPTQEGQLTQRLLLMQLICTCIAFTIRYPLAIYFYEYWEFIQWWHLRRIMEWTFSKRNENKIRKTEYANCCLSKCQRKCALFITIYSRQKEKRWTNRKFVFIVEMNMYIKAFIFTFS